MATVIFIQPDGARREVPALLGRTVMEAARRHNIPGIDAECGGKCACGTCHVHVKGEWSRRLPARSADEDAALDCAVGVLHDSRLACQIVVSAALDGLVLHL